MRIHTVLLILLMFLITGCQLFRKGRSIKAGKYYKNQELIKYAGTWRTRHARDTVELKLIQYKYLSDGTRAYYDAIKGELTFVTQGDDELISTINFGPALGTLKMEKRRKGNKYFRFYFFDSLKQKSGIAIMEFTHKNDTIAFWRLQNMERILLNGEEFDSSWSIPDSLYLYKVGRN